MSRWRRTKTVATFEFLTTVKRRGYLIATFEEPRKLYFVAKNGWSKVSETLDLEGYKASQESKFLSENLVLYSIEKKPKFTFLFDRTRSATVKKIAESVQRRLTAETIAAPTPEPAPVEAKLESAVR